MATHSLTDSLKKNRQFAINLVQYVHRRESPGRDCPRVVYTTYDLREFFPDVQERLDPRVVGLYWKNTIYIRECDRMLNVHGLVKTVLHEYAHYLSSRLDTNPHGWVFKSTMMKLMKDYG
jgi:hypothetical protein